MNKEFEQWVNEELLSTINYHTSTLFNNVNLIKSVYNHLQQNPHLLREDGEEDLAGEVEV
jgi:hypothetical protein